MWIHSINVCLKMTINLMGHRDCVRLIVFLWLMCLANSQPLALQTNHISDDCDWESNSINQIELDPAVKPVHLRCTRGTIRWFYPRDALRVILRYGSSNKDFRGCIRISYNSTTNIRVYVEGSKALHKIYSSDDGRHPDLLRCFVSTNGHAALFIEAESSKDMYRSPFKFNYHLNAISSPRGLYEDDYEDCRPCTDDELHQLYCRSDFVIHGYVMSMFQNLPLGRSELTIKSTKLIKDMHQKDSKKSATNLLKDNYYVIHRPLKCDTKSGSGIEFLFIGQWVLDNPTIKCAPTLIHWKHVRSNAIQSGSNQCQL